MAAINKLGVIGAGLMGNGIAHVAALSGIPVVLMDVQQQALDRALATMAKNMDRQVSKGSVSSADRDAALARIVTATDNSAFADCDMVIEAATENEEIKKKIFAALCPVLKPDALLASNTSSIPITRLAAATDRPGRFIGMHFFNPVPMMKLVEIIRGLATEDATYQAVEALAKRMGKAPVMAQDWPGFVVNRILCPMINEAIQALMEGVGDVAAIDAGMKLGANHPMGPLELADFVGLDTLYSVMKVLHEGLGDSKYRPSPLLAKYVEAGWYGRKSGRGFYDYSTTPPTPTR
ncbi:MAG: 3-hydroxybutyryl-CoA dehydrogenase [Roseomonas sp.]|jgi:3-hydroxybutyryl-CoA dehydrogenase|nr:3-hydroxybutyryl-CoA dehydrogenase [Roseomonas sp.]MCA3277036.1 3-hydroxybutyryl-CoA dehydrogenase [Roseomonas sp.]MCA3282414.1 3-hydroxybutyryl-CoA dehydrogenase [Roseomonas sp.]MCA3284984.1 3-hydroxybutyryl-CoA dehydrogenase [Roseomonas sp.]MCA3290813.1 3-hydroxybutyryl-CoA dehydrogenase [Roseomonas sp.]